jgi:amino acid adenylation domain-containing protein
LFSLAADKFKSHAALDRLGASVSYGELEAETNRLANFLIASGASKGSVVAIMSDNRVEFITAMIAVLKAGCIFVPLDPETPEKRLAATLGEASPQWFLAGAQFIEMLDAAAPSTDSRARVHCLSGEATDGARYENLVRAERYESFDDTRRPRVASEPDDPCYIYFTSGSTGRPKGIVGRLKAIDHFIRWETETFSIGQEARGSQLISPSFDAFLRDVFVPLCVGGTVCVPPSNETVADADLLIEWMDAQDISLVHCVPTLFRSLLSGDLHPGRFPSLRHIMLSGEPLLPSDVRRWMDVFGERVQLVNLYGPSETTMTKFFYRVEAADVERRSIPIGKPISGTRALIVDEKGQPCAPGAVGEIYIRTPYTSLGYYKRPDLTSEVFVPNPFSGDLRDIIYKTGDLGRTLKDGNFEFLGRKDSQVKVRGVRVELGEIEGLLRDHLAVADVAVVSQEEPNGNNSLCAYLVLKDEVELGLLREHLSASLPPYMLPSYFVPMDALPRTLSGKVDRRALPKPEHIRSEQSAPYVPPRTPVEEALVDIWGKVLGLTRIGINDNFFTLGGHSLLATQLLSRVRAAFDVELHLRSLFEGPTVAEQALVITQIQVEQEGGEEMTALIEEIKAMPIESAENTLDLER